MKKSIAVAALAALCWSSVCAQVTPGKAVKNVGVVEFDKLRKQTNSVVLDVRTPKEFTAGHIPGAVNIDWNGADFQKKVSALDKSKTYLVQCAVGGRSAKAADKMMTLQFTNVYNLEGGIKAWEKAGKPVEK
jgi:rhodanese-related sulfurtransferase